MRQLETRLRLLCLLLVAFGLQLQAAPSAGNEKDRVLVLAAYHPGHYWQQTEVDSLLAKLARSSPKLAVDVEYLDLGRFTAAGAQQRLLPGLLTKYGSNIWRVVVVLDQPGLDFGLRNRERLFPSAAVVFCGVENYSEATAAANPQVTGVIERIDPAANAKLALTLQPELDHIMVVSGDTNGFGGFTDVKTALAGTTGAPEIEFFTGFNTQELFARLADMPTNSAIVFIGFSRAQEYSVEIRRRTRVPIYTMHWPTFLGMGVGGVMVDAEYQGEDAATMVLRILDGVPPSSIPVVRNPRFRTLVDYNELKRFGISLDRVPSDALVVNQPESLWIRHRASMLLTIWIFVLLAILVVGLAVALRQKQRAETALAKSEKRFRHLVENSDDMVLELDAKGRVTYASPNCQRWLGFEPSELSGRTIAESTNMEATSTKPEEQHPVRRHRHKNGSWRWLEWSTREAATESGGMVSVVVLRDVTDRVAADEARLTLEKRVHQAEKMEALGTLAGGIAHDFNNLLTPILGHTSLLEETAQDAESVESIKEIHIAAKRAADLVKSILTFSRMGPNRREPTDLSGVVEESRKLLRASLPPSIRIDTLVTPNIPAILADRTRVQQILLNLGHNAAHAMTEGGTISISLGSETVDEAFCKAHPPLKPGLKVVLAVADTGTGMDGVTLHRIFEPFFTTKAPGKGTGLGLSVVLGIVQDHLAAITVDSRPGAGTRFSIYFDPTTEIPQPASKEARKPSSAKGERVLLVDDEPAVGHVGAAMLRQLGYHCEVMADPRRALERLGDILQPPVDLVITDLSMPHLNGMLLAEKILFANPGQRIILASGLAESLGHDLVLSKGIKAVLPKPYALAGLAAVVSQVLSQPPSKLIG